MAARPAKRLLDLAAASAGLLLLLPLLTLTAGAILVTDGRPVFFRQVRVGQGGSQFRIWKFRTMKQTEGRALTVGSDPRITGVGRYLRQWKLDELPQLINVIRGEMSLVGPRPEVPRYVDQYDADQRAVLELVPGITDPASVRYRDESRRLAEVDDPESHYVNVIMPDKIRINLEYADRATTWSDVGVIVRTLLPKG